MKLFRDFEFDAAHNLTEYHGKCERLHGHTYRMTIEIDGSPGDDGLIIDFAEVKRIVNDEVISRLDHAYINDFMPQPSAENIARWAFERLDPLLRGERHRLESVRIYETPRSSALFSREDL